MVSFLPPTAVPPVLRVMPAPTVARVVRPEIAWGWAGVAWLDIDDARCSDVDRPGGGDNAARDHRRQDDNRQDLEDSHGLLLVGARAGRAHLPICLLTPFSCWFSVFCSCLVM